MDAWFRSDFLRALRGVASIVAAVTSALEGSSPTAVTIAIAVAVTLATAWARASVVPA